MSEKKETLPHVILHIGVSLDGRIDWSLGDEGLFYALASRWQVDAMLSGSNTILAAEVPEMPPTGWGFEVDPAVANQRLVVVDSRGRVRNWHLLKQQPWWRDPIALCSASTNRDYLGYLEGEGIDYLITGQEQVDLRAALAELKASYGIEKIRVDSGGILYGVFLREGLADEVSVLINPELVGGTTPRSMFVAPDLTGKEGIIKLHLTHLEKLREEHVWLRYDVLD